MPWISRKVHRASLRSRRCWQVRTVWAHGVRSFGAKPRSTTRGSPLEVLAERPATQLQRWPINRAVLPLVPLGTTPGGHRYRCKGIGSYARAQELLRQGHTYLDGNRDGEACESLR